MNAPKHRIENRETYEARLRNVLAPSEFLLVQIAYTMAKAGQRWQTRMERDDVGDPVRAFEHLRATALVMIDELNIIDYELIIACKLHDAFEDSRDITPPMVELMFGKKVVKLIQRVTKNPKEGYYERLLNCGDVEAMLIKGCDNLSNMRTLVGSPPAFQAKQLANTRKDIYPIMNEACCLAIGTKYERATQTIRKLLTEQVESHVIS